MDRLMENRSVFVIAHRLSTVRNSEAILVLEKGTIIERGSHEELLEDKGRYYQLYTGQFELELSLIHICTPQGKGAKKRSLICAGDQEGGRAYDIGG